MRKFELFAGYLGNGITICNKAVLEDGDYKIVAHISNGGNLKLRVSADYIPTKDMETIKRWAETQRSMFRERFEGLPAIKQYAEILDNCDASHLLQFLEDKRPLSEKLPDMKAYYFSIA